MAVGIGAGPEGTAGYQGAIGLSPAVDAVEGSIDHVLVPVAVPGLGIGFDAGKEIGAGSLLGGQALGAESLTSR
jgi:hypothetical protein